MEGNDVINQTRLSPQLTYNFDQLLLAINNHCQKMGQGNKTIVVKSPAFALVINLASVGLAQKKCWQKVNKRVKDLMKWEVKILEALDLSMPI